MCLGWYWWEDQEGAGRLLGEEGLQRGHRRSTWKHRYFLNSRSSCEHLITEGCFNLGCGSGSALICNLVVLLVAARVADLQKKIFSYPVGLVTFIWIRIWVLTLMGFVKDDVSLRFGSSFLFADPDLQTFLGSIPSMAPGWALRKWALMAPLLASTAPLVVTIAPLCASTAPLWASQLHGENSRQLLDGSGSSC